MTIERTRLNDVDLEAVGTLIESIRKDSAAASTTWAATVEWERGFASRVKVRDHEYLKSDEPPALGGEDTAPNPVEQLLGAFGNCLAVGYAANATAAGIELKDLRIELEGDLDLHTFLGLADGNAGFDGVRVNVHLDTDADADAVRQLHDKVVSTSPVGHTLSRPIPLDVSLA
jgi:uncharacterized OsmC-like protein